MIFSHGYNGAGHMRKIFRIFPFNPHTPVAQKVSDEVVFRRFQGEGVEVF